MLPLEENITTFFLLFAVSAFFVSYHQTKYKKNAFGLALILNPIGGFVWADGVIFGLFWTIASLVILSLDDWILFLLTYSIFWLVRSVGETIYWFNQQFSPINRNPVENLPYIKIFHNDSIWFVSQIFWQCITVVSIITTLYLAHIWLASLK